MVKFVIFLVIMKNDKPVVGVIGVGHLGQHHVKHYQLLEDANLAGLYDIDSKRADIVAKQYKSTSFKNDSDLITVCDAVSVVTPTETHIDVAEQAINNNCHVFIEKPITKTVEDADHLLKLAEKQNVLIQVGHIERLNPALRALQAYNINPKFVEIQRLAPYTVRGTDVPVVLDLMIHDIDILLSIVKSSVKNIRASGVSILTDSIDIAHARIRFENGTVASIVSSRIAQDKVRKVKVFQQNLYATIDLLLGITEVYQVIDIPEDSSDALMTASFKRNGEEKYIAYEKPAIDEKDVLQLELQNFICSMIGKDVPIVDGKAGRAALAVATQIQDMIIQDIH